MSRSAAAVAAAVSAVTLAALTACTAGSGSPPKPSGPNADPGPPAAYRLVSFTDCNAALDGLRTAARNNVIAWGGRRLAVDDYRAQGDAATGAGPPAAGVPDSAGAREAAPSDKQADSGYSGTNTHEAGVDEPDLVKT